MTRILAVIDPREEIHHALERCKGVPADSDLDIHAVLFIESASAESFSKIFAEKSAWLKEQVIPYQALGYRITTEVVPFSTLYQSVIETAAKYRADYVVKPMRQHSLFASMVRTSTDWNLIRHCPYPLMLVSELDSIAGKPMLAAVDVMSGEDNHDRLNEVVIGRGKALGGVLGCDLHLVNAWRASTPMMAVGSVDSTPMPTPADLHKQHLEGVHALAASHGVPDEGLHVEEGAPAYVINRAAEAIGAGMIVIGTVARTGLSGALIGNTAESVLESTRCDVLVVKLKD